MPKPVLSEADLARVEAAVESAERRTAGEIVPLIVRHSDDYDAAVWRAAAAGALVGTAAELAVAALYDGWGLSWVTSSWALAGASVAYSDRTHFLRALAAEHFVELGQRGVVELGGQVAVGVALVDVDDGAFGQVVGEHVDVA